MFTQILHVKTCKNVKSPFVSPHIPPQAWLFLPVLQGGWTPLTVRVSISRYRSFLNNLTLHDGQACPSDFSGWRWSRVEVGGVQGGGNVVSGGNSSSRQGDARAGGNGGMSDDKVGVMAEEEASGVPGVQVPPARVTPPGSMPGDDSGVNANVGGVYATVVGGGDGGAQTVPTDNGHNQA